MFKKLPDAAKLDYLIGYYVNHDKFISEITYRTNERDDVHEISIRTVDFITQKAIPEMFFLLEAKSKFALDVIEESIVLLNLLYNELGQTDQTYGLYELMNDFERKHNETKSEK
jgi:hypothetical protein